MSNGNDPIQQAIDLGAPTTGALPSTSRYYRIGTNTFVIPGREPITYFRRRMLPDPADFALLQRYTVVQGDRLDNVTASFLGDPSQFWRLCDANRVMVPEELEVVGRSIDITLPQGIPGPITRA
jgi:hypothetical protein